MRVEKAALNKALVHAALLREKIYTLETVGELKPHFSSTQENPITLFVFQALGESVTISDHWSDLVNQQLADFHRDEHIYAPRLSNFPQCVFLLRTFQKDLLQISKKLAPYSAVSLLAGPLAGVTATIWAKETDINHSQEIAVGYICAVITAVSLETHLLSKRGYVLNPVANFLHLGLPALGASISSRLPSWVINAGLISSTVLDKHLQPELAQARTGFFMFLIVWYALVDISLNLGVDRLIKPKLPQKKKVFSHSELTSLETESLATE